MVRILLTSNAGIVLGQTVVTARELEKATTEPDAALAVLARVNPTRNED